MTARLSDAGMPPVTEAASKIDARALYVGPPERASFAWYHGATPMRECGVVLCPPIGSESTGFHRGFRHWAEHLASAGFPTVRVDYPGFGDSSGETEDPRRLRAWLDSIRDAASFLRDESGVRHVALAGLQLGATLAVGAAAELGDVDALILWVAYATGRAFLREGRAFTQLMGAKIDPERASLAPGAEQFGGMVLSGETVAELNAFDPLASGQTLRAQALVIPREPAASDATLIRNLTNAGVQVERKVSDGFAAMMADAHQAQVPLSTIESTVDWLAARYPTRRPAPARAPAHSRSSESAVVAPARLARGNEPAREAVTETPLHFGRNGQYFGVLSAPANGPRREVGVLLVNAGAVYRAGPNRVYVNLARRWASLGYTVLRFDIGGLGDSPTPAGGEENHSYPSHAVDDIENGLVALKLHGARRLVVGGLCSGAHATFHAGIGLDSVDGMMVINPIVFYWKSTDPLDVAAWRTYVDSQYYKQSARTWRSWLRLVRGRVNVRHIVSIAMRRSGEVARAKLDSLRRRFRSEKEDAAGDLRRIITGGTEVCLLFSEGDPGLDFIRLRYARELRELEQDPSFTLRVIDDADHTFTSSDARRRAIEALTAHLLAKHP